MGRTVVAPIPFMLIAAALALCAGGCSSFSDYARRPDARPIEPSEPTSAQEERLTEAYELKEQGALDEALGIFQEILGENPTITVAYLGVGDIYMVQQDYAKAEPAFARAARLEPRNFDAQYGHGLSLQMLDRYSEAIQAYHRALTVRPEDAKANLNIATSYLHVRDAGKALTFAEKAVANEPDNGPARANLGAVYEELGRSAEAVDEYIAALELMGNQPPLMVNLVNVLAKEKRYREAANTAQTLVRIEPSANAYERLGWCHFKLREYDLSTEAYKDAVGIDPQHWPSLNGIGVNALNRWLVSGRTDDGARIESRDAFRRSLSVNPSQERVVELMLKYQF